MAERIFASDFQTDKMGNPLCMRITRAIPANRPVPVSRAWRVTVVANFTRFALSLSLVGFVFSSVREPHANGGWF